jgi:hypothetical protein
VPAVTTPDDDQTLPEAAASEGYEAPYEAPDDEPVAAAPVSGGKRWLLALLAGLGVALVGVVLWGVLYAVAKREFVGTSVVVGLVIGYVVREVSRRSDLPARLLAVLVTALACVGGTVVGEAAYTAAHFKIGFWRVFGDLRPQTWELLQKRTNLQLAIYAVALVIAFLAAGPAKPKPAAAGTTEPVAEPETAETAEPVEPAAPADEA